MRDGFLRSERFLGANRALAGIVGLLIITAVSIVPLTLTILQLRQSDALVIDIAGRQRMLLERHMKELLLAAEGVDRSYLQTREVLGERAAVLTRGGSTLSRVEQGGTLVLPPAPTDAIRAALLQQQRLLEAFVLTADRFLNHPRATADYRAVRDEVLKDNAVLLAGANEVVMMLARHAEERMSRLVRWEVIMVLLVVTVASVGTRRFVQSEQALKQSQALALDALRQSDAVKSSLLSSISHELRTPLTAIKTMFFNLQEKSGELPAHVRKECFRSIDEELDYLNRLVGNLLDMSRIEAGQLKPNREWHLLEELVEGAIRLVGPRLEQRVLQIELTPDLPPLYVDGVEMQRVLVNLLDNAVKFASEDSPIRIGAAVIDRTVEISVSNTGEGIPPGELERVFDRFYRVTSSHAAAKPGTGLGLAICKGIVEAHGGRIEARSIPDRDTTISFRLPLMNAPVREQEAAHA